jgi:formimidoylglutamate deiminase
MASLWHDAGMEPSANDSEHVVLPGFANAHSHAFQRLLRGRVQRGLPRAAAGERDSFWTWRETMYACAETLDVAALEASARLTWAECLEAGYTAVGEFHYLHRPTGAVVPGIEAAQAMIRAARQTGIRLRLLMTAYRRGGFGTPLSARQQRFDSGTVAELSDWVDTLSASLSVGDRAHIGLGFAIHSVRAVEPELLGAVAEAARVRGMPLHVHASEQPAEVVACRQHMGLSPIGLLDAMGVLGPDCGVVHATHVDAADIALLAARGATVILCPTTEGDLGDGVPPTDAFRHAGVPLAIGSDSHAVIDPFAELRRLEYDARAATGRRCVVVGDDGDPVPALLDIGAAQGMRVLGFEGVGDRVTLRSGSRFFSGVAPGDRAAAALLGGSAALVDQVEVAGQTLVVDGRHVAVGLS